MELSMRDLDILVEAIGTLIAEYGGREDERELLVRVREVRERRYAEIERGR